MLDTIRDVLLPVSTSAIFVEVCPSFMNHSVASDKVGRESGACTVKVCSPRIELVAASSSFCSLDSVRSFCLNRLRAKNHRTVCSDAFQDSIDFKKFTSSSEGGVDSVKLCVPVLYQSEKEVYQG